MSSEEFVRKAAVLYKNVYDRNTKRLMEGYIREETDEIEQNVPIMIQYLAAMFHGITDSFNINGNASLKMSGNNGKVTKIDPNGNLIRFEARQEIQSNWITNPQIPQKFEWILPYNNPFVVGLRSQNNDNYELFYDGAKVVNGSQYAYDPGEGWKTKDIEGKLKINLDLTKREFKVEIIGRGSDRVIVFKNVNTNPGLRYKLYAGLSVHNSWIAIDQYQTKK